MFEVAVDGGLLRGAVAGQGDPVLLLHGGPGLPSTYLRPLVDELAESYEVATYQQRGLPPSTAGAPYDVRTQVADVVAVLDGLGWERAVVAGHSWGGHLLLHLLAEHRERVVAALIIDPLGGVGDGGEAEFDAELMRRTPARDVARVQHLEQQAMSGRGSEADLMESMRLLWPAYFADPAAAPPFPDLLCRRRLCSDLRVVARRAARPGGSARRRRRAHAVRARRREPDAGLGLDRQRGGHRFRGGSRGTRRRRSLPVD